MNLEDTNEAVSGLSRNNDWGTTKRRKLERRSKETTKNRRESDLQKRKRKKNKQRTETKKMKISPMMKEEMNRTMQTRKEES